MRKFLLTKCIADKPSVVINHFFGQSIMDAIAYFNEYGALIHENINLNRIGYQVVGNITYMVQEEFNKI